MSPGRVIVRVAAMPDFSIEAVLNEGNGINGLRELYQVLGLEAGQVVHFEAPSPDTKMITYHGEPTQAPFDADP